MLGRRRGVLQREMELEATELFLPGGDIPASTSSYWTYTREFWLSRD